MSTIGDSLPVTDTTPTTDEQWLQWALSVFGGNHVRATAAASAAAEARRAGVSSDDLFAAAQAAYNDPPAAAGPIESAKPAAPVVAYSDTDTRVVRPSGRSVLGLVIAGMLVAGIIDVFARVESSYVAPAILVLVLVLGVWFALSLRSSVRIAGGDVIVQGALHRIVLHRIDIRQVAVQPRLRQMSVANGPLRGQFVTSLVGNDSSHLVELRQGGWTRTDIDRIGAAIGVDVVNDSTPSVT